MSGLHLTAVNEVVPKCKVVKFAMGNHVQCNKIIILIMR